MAQNGHLAYRRSAPRAPFLPSRGISTTPRQDKLRRLRRPRQSDATAHIAQAQRPRHHVLTLSGLLSSSSFSPTLTFCFTHPPTAPLLSLRRLLLLDKTAGAAFL